MTMSMKYDAVLEMRCAAKVLFFILYNYFLFERYFVKLLI